MTAATTSGGASRTATDRSRAAASTTWAVRLTQVATGLTVAGLAGVAGAISFAHMAALAVDHGQLGWKSTAFPISVDGLELVASLYILTQRRAGRRPGLLPWAALLVGTAASLAANVAVGGHDLVGRALAGWPVTGWPTGCAKTDTHCPTLARRCY